ncbi:TIGR01777 family oxidoreductase [Nesterenkonia muleiensis]|uniref:TIGR01777 family oxidoreductase n=1 Tax=Nesterenkonia muleiensis TaxID=2282648 RepID=UPI000E77059A|nr:TIGR01777 family oxidoreductase [Nesterenkonia muleiensis]
MPVLSYESHLPFAREDVFSWYERPGALVRLHPPFAGRVVDEPTDGLKPGSESTLGINLPGLLGTSLSAIADLLGNATSLPLRSWVRWRARHTDYQPGRSMTDEMLSGPAKSWRHERHFEDDGAGTVLRETLTYQLPVTGRLPGAGQDVIHRQFETELRRIFDFRTRQTTADLAFHQSHHGLDSQQKGSGTAAAGLGVVAVSGASGMIGRQVCALLGGAGIEVRTLVRSTSGAADSARGKISWDPDAGRLDPADLREVDAVIHLAGHPLMGRFTDKHKKAVLDSRVEGTTLIAEALAALEREDSRGRALVSGSAIGFYGASAEHREHGHQILTEEHGPGTDFLADVCRQWEEATSPAQEAGVRTALIRTGIVQSPLGGVLAQMLPLFAVGAGGPLGDDQYQSWISIDDIASLIVHLALSPGAEGPVNGVAPEPVTAKEYARTLAAVLRRPSAIPVPAFGPQLLLGKQGAKELAQADQRVSAEKALGAGYAFRHPALPEALHHLLGR